MAPHLPCHDSGVEDSSRACSPHKKAATEASRTSLDGRGTVAEQSPSFDIMSMVRNRGSDPTPPLLSALVVDFGHGEQATEAADVWNRPWRRQNINGDGPCDVSGMMCDRRFAAGFDGAVQAPEGVGDSSRGHTPGMGAATAGERGVRDCRGASSDQSQAVDFMAMVRVGGSEPTPPPPRAGPVIDLLHGEPVQGSSPAATSIGTGSDGRGPVDIGCPSAKKNCHGCGRQWKSRCTTAWSTLWVCGKKCGRWACGSRACLFEASFCCYCDLEAGYGCECFK